MPPRILFFKAASIPDGARWITVRPNGPGTKGQPVLVQPQKDGSMHVIGGAGGKLNYLKLHGVKHEGDLAKEASARQAERREARREQIQRERADGTHQSKSKAREMVRTQRKAHEVAFVETVAKELGWSPEETRFPEEAYQNASAEAFAKAAKDHAAGLLKRAKEAVQAHRQQVLLDANARSAAGLGEVPLIGATPDDITVQDLDPIQPTARRLGFDPAYKARAEAAGATPEAVKQEAREAKGQEPAAPPADKTPAQRAKEKGERIRDELKAIRDPSPRIDPTANLDARRTMALLKAEKAMREASRQAKAANKKIDAADGQVEPNAFVIEVSGEHVEREAVRELENDLKTLRTRAFLSEVGKAGNAEALGSHAASGGFNALNAVALAAGGTAMLDRSAVDVLGVAGAAQVLARRLTKDLTPEEMADLRTAMASFHVDHYMATSDEALREARDLHEMAQEIELGEGASTADLVQAQELNARRRDLTEKAQKILGTALGEMEGNAALVAALERPDRDSVQVSMGGMPLESAIQQVRAIGLNRGDYRIERAGSSTILTIHGTGMDRLAQPVSRADLIRARESLDIIEGRQDEDGWLPAGVSRRPDAGLLPDPGVAPRLGKPMASNPADMEQALRDYIGGRAADGDSPAEIVASLLSEDTIQRAGGDRGAYMAAVEKLAPLYDDKGQMIRAESHADRFAEMADSFVGRAYGGELAPLHRQQVTVDQTSLDSLHHALSQHPDGVLAFKPVGDLSPQDQRALRATFAREFARNDPEAQTMQARLDHLDGQEPEREVNDMFGRGTNPEWTSWKKERDELAEQLGRRSLTWGKYIETMGGPANAYEAMQDIVRGHVLRAFADHHNATRPGAPLKIGRQAIVHDLDHLDATDPDARDRRAADQRALVDRLRTRVAGRYASGSVADKLDAAREAEAAQAQAQMGLFGAEELPEAPAAGEPVKEAEPGQRYTIGHAAERQIAAMMTQVGQNFRPGQKPEIWKPNMSGRFVGRQRAVKLIAKNRRVALGLGVGSGKTSIMLSAFTQLHSQGQAKRGLFVVPSVVQGQFGGEALTLLEAGKYRWHANPGASREERIAALKDPANHFNVTTHQSLRDDILHLAAQQHGATPDAIVERLEGMAPEQRRDFVRDVLTKEGIDHDFMAVDEGHNLLNREGKADSRMATVLDALSHGMGTYVNATADPVKNDVSEAYDVLRKMDPGRYRDRDAFMRRYGVDTEAAKDSLRREMARYFYTGKIDPGVKADHKVVTVPLSEEQKTRLAAIDDATAKARLARMRGALDMEALKTLSPGSFEGVPEDRHEEVARNLMPSLGVLREAATLKAVGGGAKIDTISKEAAARRGRPGVIFAHNLEHVKQIAERLTREGHRVVTLTGGDGSKEKDRKKRGFQAGEHDIMVASDAGAVGMNAQRGKWLIQHDTPNTAMVHAQRNGRIHRNGQTEDVELIDLQADHPAERKARDRVAKKYALREIMTSPLEGLDDHGIAGYLNRVRAAKNQESADLFGATPHQPEAPAGLDLFGMPETAHEPEPEEQANLF